MAIVHRSCLLLLGLLLFMCIGNGYTKLVKNSNYEVKRVRWQIAPNSMEASVFINTTQKLYTVDRRFMSVVISAHLMRNRWKTFDFNSIRLKNLARGLSPAYLRFGGSDSNFVIFNSTTGNTQKFEGQRSDEESPYKKTFYRTNFTMTASDWDNLNEFASDAGWDMMFDLNMILRNGSKWDPTNAIELMEYTTRKGYRIAGWEMGNEPNHINHHANMTMPADQLGRDFIALRKVLDNYGYKESFLIGPGVTPPIPRPHKSEKDSMIGQDGRTYLRSFLQNCGNSTSATSWHYYTFYGPNATADNFTDPGLTNALIKQIHRVQRFIQTYRPYLPQSWITETAGAFGGGAPGLSDAYAGGILWLDRLGVCASHGVGIVFRESFYIANYALVTRTYDPTPVYWVSLLFKQLVGSIVLSTNVTIGLQSEDENGNLKENVQDNLLGKDPTHVRVYAHCTNINSSLGSIYAKGSVTIFVINLKKSNSISLNVAGALGQQTVYQYLLTPSKDGDITSTIVNLNGKALMLTKDDALPNMEGKKLSQDEALMLPPLTYGFFVLNGTTNICL